MTVSIVGAGNVGSHLAAAFFNSGVEIAFIASKSEHSARALAHSVNARETNDLPLIQQQSDVLIIAVNDDAIAEVAQSLDKRIETCQVVHTAGSIGSEVLGTFKHHGVFYPLQTFTSERTVDWSTIPILITSSDKTVSQSLMTLARHLSKVVRTISDRDRLVLHLCATVANNFGNHMLTLSKSIADHNAVDFELLKPLILETANKVMSLSPVTAQTGAAKRNDELTMQKHLALLQDSPEMALLYQAISNSILSTIDNADDQA